MRNPKHVLMQSLLALACFPLAAAACGGRTLENGTDGGSSARSDSTDDPNGQDGSSPPPTNESSGGGSSGDFPVCPNLAPKPGWSCGTPNQGCAYVDFGTGVCTSVTCDSSGHWVSSTPAGC